MSRTRDPTWFMCATFTRHIPPLPRTSHRHVWILEHPRRLGESGQVAFLVAVEFDFTDTQTIIIYSSVYNDSDILVFIVIICRSCCNRSTACKSAVCSGTRFTMN